MRGSIASLFIVFRVAATDTLRIADNVVCKHS